MKKLILLLVALPLFLANCTKDADVPDNPTLTTTTYSGFFTTGTIDANVQQTPAVVVVTENSSTDWSMSLEVSGQPAQVFTTTKSGDIIQFLNQTYQGTSVNGKGELSNGTELRFVVETNGTTTATVVGSFLGKKQ